MALTKVLPAQWISAIQSNPLSVDDFAGRFQRLVLMRAGMPELQNNKDFEKEFKKVQNALRKKPHGLAEMDAALKEVIDFLENEEKELTFRKSL